MLWHGSSHSEVTDLDLALIIHENIGWLQVSVNDIGRVHEVYSTEQIVHNVFEMILTKLNLAPVMEQGSDVCGF